MYEICAKNQDDFTQELMELLPEGDIWPEYGEGSDQELYWNGMAWLFDQASNYDCRLLDETNPYLASLYIENWEADYGLPDSCLDAAELTITQRRNSLIAKLRSEGGNTVADYLALINGLGYDAQIIEYRPFVCGHSECGDDHMLGGDDVRFWWHVELLSEQVFNFEAGENELNDRLGDWSFGDELPCILNREKPAFTLVTFGVQ